MSVYERMLSEYQGNFNTRYSEVAKFIMNFISTNGEALASKNPAKYIYFTKGHRDEFFSAVNVDPAQIKSFIRESSYIESKWIIPNEPLNMLMDTMVFYYFSMRSKYKDMSYPPHLFVNFMFALRFYSSLQQRQFKYEANEEVMAYTIDNLSKKYNITKANSMFEILSYYADSNIVSWDETKGMEKTDDASIVGYMNRLNTRLSSFIKNIAEEYYKNHEDSKRVVEEKTTIDFEDGKSQLKTQTNISNDINILTRNIVTSFRQNPTNVKLLKTACNNTDASFSEMHIVMEDFRKGGDDLPDRLISNMISYYLVSEKADKSTIKSGKFLETMTMAYNISNTQDTYIIEIKKVLDEIMNKYSDFYTKTNRTASKVQLRSACYRYMIYMIMSYC